MKRLATVVAAAVVSAMLAACGASSTKSAGTDATPQVAKTAKTTIRVKFPAQVTKSLIPSGTTSMYVSWESYSDSVSGAYIYDYGFTTITPDAAGNGTASVSLIPGNPYRFQAQCLDADGGVISRASASGRVKAGDNNILISFAQAVWTFVDANNAAAPITLSGDETLGAFMLTNYNSYYNSSDYDLAWFDGTGNITAANGYAWLDSYFLGGTATGSASTSLTTDTYNLTTKSWGSPEGAAVGDRFLTILSSGDEEFTTTPDISSYFNTIMTNGKTFTGTVAELTMAGGSITPTGNACSDGGSAVAKAAIAKALGAPRKAASMGAVTVSFTDCGYYDDEPFVDANSNGYYDAGDTFTDFNGSGTRDYFGSYAEENVTVQFSSVNVYPFTATGTEPGSATGTIIIE